MNQSRPKAKLSRRLGIPLTPKCVRYFERRPFPPGVHGRRRQKSSDYATRLLEKQRLRHQYDLSEGQLRRTFAEAARRPGPTGENLVALLERRLDATVLRSGLARTIYQARQTVTHRHVMVNGRRVDKPSYRVRPGDVVEIVPASRAKNPFLAAAAGAHAPERPVAYLSANLPELRTTVLRDAARSEVPIICDTQLVVEFYSR
ncbi:30S ribosomal protein S4 [Natronosporangium hydrolyticum]|uniref:Small ribosomal subunit protein uS4 n=1 Tax=Natronosporangium hydrolyticum TaxID=2811111 RepID=A0A895YC61_9ACTN|nr:30S ribosomal protein S4 [Natronosporangium hydrolyticum]QSB13835.1 30S ribosomal protein S4 [Natronosporangium hydrolyticum]